MTTQLLVHLICDSVQLITHFASGQALGKKCFLSGVVVAQEGDEEKPLLAGASVTTTLFGVVVPAALIEAARALGKKKAHRKTRRSVAQSGTFVAMGGDGKPAGEWNQETWLESPLSNLVVAPEFTCSTSQWFISFICKIGLL